METSGVSGSNSHQRRMEEHTVLFQVKERVSILFVGWLGGQQLQVIHSMYIQYKR